MKGARKSKAQQREASTEAGSGDEERQIAAAPRLKLLATIQGTLFVALFMMTYELVSARLPPFS
jgi:hypothetical protein